MPKRADCIRLRGVRQNNLKGFDLDLPIGRLTVVTGLSGAGKSSLVFETLHAEGQRRYVETFSPYTRQFMELLGRPAVDSIENIRPSIAIQQSNTVKSSRSTVGTITELCDYFKVWFANAATLHDPATGRPISDDSPQSAWKEILEAHRDETLFVTFEINKPDKLEWPEILESLGAQGYTRAIHKEALVRIEEICPSGLNGKDGLQVIQDRLTIQSKTRSRFIEAAQQAFAFGKGRLQLFDTTGGPLAEFTQGLSSPETGKTFRPATPALFSFNSPIGACPACRGFGRVIEIDDRLVIPDHRLSIDEGAIRAFQGGIYGASLRDLQRAAKKHKVRTHIPWSRLNKRELKFVMMGEPDHKPGGNKWYGVRRFFDWLNGNLYKMHVRVFLSKFRSYSLCPACQGARLQAEALNWKWQGRALPELYRKSVSELIEILEGAAPSLTQTGAGTGAGGNGRASPASERNSAFQGVLSRLCFLRDVGLGYLTLDRSSRSLSGGETMRVNLTSCLGSALTDTLFVLDEPSVGLHPRDMERLIDILRRLTGLGNTVVVVEHDEAVMRAADHLIEVGPEPGINGGRLTFEGSCAQILKSETRTGRFLSGREEIPVPGERRICPSDSKTLSISGASKHNIRDLSLRIPQQRLVCLSGVSGSGKSTLLNNVIYQNLLAQKGLSVEDPASIRDIESGLPLSEVVLIDQSPASKTPRATPASFTGAWDGIRKVFSKTEMAKAADMGPGYFSYNSSHGRCETCSGLGSERIEMQFLSDIYVPCETCEGRRFKDEALEITYNNRNIADIQEMDVTEALIFFSEHPGVVRPLQSLIDVGLGYLKLGQPLNTLSGGESQRLKLVRYLGRITPSGSASESRKKRSSPPLPGAVTGSNGRGGDHSALILIDEPTTGLHRADVKRLIAVFQKLVDAGRSLIVIEHNLDLLKVADWIVEMGPEAGPGGGRVVAQGTPEQIARAGCETASYLREALHEGRFGQNDNPDRLAKQATSNAQPIHLSAQNEALAVAEKQSSYNVPDSIFGVQTSAFPKRLSIKGAREHNLKNVSTEIDHNKVTVITGVSGSGKSSLAFDIIFAEGQRRFMESMSAYARQFVEQMPRAEVDELHGIAPTIAIEQRVTRGSRKSTVATITEVAQYLRLLYARIGIQHSPTSGEAVVRQSEAVLQKRLTHLLQEYQASDSKFKVEPGPTRQATNPVVSPEATFATLDLLYLCAPLLRGRKGHHGPLANWARDHGYSMLRIDGQLVPLDQFQKLDRYKEHDIDLVVAAFPRGKRPGVPAKAEAAYGRTLPSSLKEALKLGKGSALLLDGNGTTLSWLSTRRTDPATGEAYPELDPKHFSWNSPRGWCPACRGYGQLFDWMTKEDEENNPLKDRPHGAEDGEICPDCNGARLNKLSRAVRLALKKRRAPNAQGSTPSRKHSKLDVRSSIFDLPESASLPELLSLTPIQLIRALKSVKTTTRTKPILNELLPEIEERLRFMDRVGLGYLTLDRATATLSGGEAQRIRLAAQLGSNLSGALYVLDEPSIGLHARDNARLIESLKQLRERGNTLVIVEHDEATMRHADKIIDLGPAAGVHGGEIVASGTLAQIKRNKQSITGKYLRKGMTHPLRGSYRELPPPWSPRKKKSNESWISLQGAALRNLKGFDAQIPKRCLTVVCGVSGAGKSSLIRDLLKPLVKAAALAKAPKFTPKDLVTDQGRTSNAARRKPNKANIQSSKLDAAQFSKQPAMSLRPEQGATFKALHHANDARHVIEVDQSPIGKTPRSTPATYIGAFDIIRQIYARLPRPTRGAIPQAPSPSTPAEAAARPARAPDA